MLQQVIRVITEQAPAPQQAPAAPPQVIVFWVLLPFYNDFQTQISVLAHHVKILKNGN